MTVMAKAPTFSTEKWLKDDLGFTDAQIPALLPLFEPVRAKIEGGYLRQADYSRLMNEGKTEIERLQTELTAKDQQLTREMTEWASLRQGDDRKAETLRAELEKSQLEKFQLEQRIRTIAEEQGIDVTKVLPAASGNQPPTPPVPPTPAVDLDKLVSREQFGSVVDYMLAVPAQLTQIGYDHHKLYPDTPMDAVAIVNELKNRVAKKQPADLRQIWEEMYKVPAKREEVAKAKYEADIKAAEDRGREAARSEVSLPGQHPTGTHAPIFRHPEGQTDSKLQRPQPGQNVRGYADALRTRKYAQGPAAKGQK